MKLEDQCVSLDLAKRLKELNVKQNSLFFHTLGGVVSRLEALPILETNYSAYTCAELGEILSSRFNEWAQGYNDCYSQWYFSYGNRGAGAMIEGIGERSFSDQEHEVNARAELLIHLIEQGLVKVEDINNA